ncbi:MAG TPA: hypothetical protein VML95_02130 [Longimicrobiales bacterium]|nr:hypothetical protein [Longimicrobiales bacterium]
MTVLSAAELAEALGLSGPRAVYRLCADGMPRRGRGAYALEECAAWYGRHLAPTNGAVPPIQAARARQLSAAALRAERKLAKLERSVLPTDVADAVHDAYLRTLADRFRRLPEEWTPALLGIEGRRAALVVLRDLRDVLMAEISEDPDGSLDAARRALLEEAGYPIPDDAEDVGDAAEASDDA